MVTAESSALNGSDTLREISMVKVRSLPFNEVLKAEALETLLKCDVAKRGLNAKKQKIPSTPDLGSDDVYGAWRINDMDHTFQNQICKAGCSSVRHDLIQLISGNKTILLKQKGPSISAVILKFELMYAPVLENGFGLQSSLDACSASVHEFRIPPKALLGLRSYFPVHFDTFHAVLVDITVHIILLKGGVRSVPPKVPSDSSVVKDVAGENYDKSKHVMLVRALLTARGILLEELQKMSNAFNHAIDLTDFTSGLVDSRFGSLRGGVKTTHAERSTEASGKKPNGIVDFQSNEFFHSLSKDELLYYFHSLGSQILYLWITFLKFHSGVDGSYHGIRGKVSVLRKLTDDVIDQLSQTAAISTTGLYETCIYFGDPSGIPIIIVEHVVNAPLCSTSGNSYFTHLNQKDTSSLSTDIGFKGKSKLSAACP
ncbi:hypothetical protein HYC85_020466 [Camellia sinensis]|uniref:Uncharacterized protein n=1 Tax=Camellia sinensis TaxID=4442 RepID=A0A7J7GTN4_CAMSI|nr:hypothetical protein HYC85_020466 [Camellia sinensis]